MVKTLILRYSSSSRDCINGVEIIDQDRGTTYAKYHAVILDNHYLLYERIGKDVLGIEDIERFPPKKEDKARIESRLIQIARDLSREMARVNKCKLLDKIEQS